MLSPGACYLMESIDGGSAETSSWRGRDGEGRGMASNSIACAVGPRRSFVLGGAGWDRLKTRPHRASEGKAATA